MGQRVLQPIVNQQVSQVLGALDKQVQEAKPRAQPRRRPRRRAHSRALLRAFVASRPSEADGICGKPWQRSTSTPCGPEWPSARSTRWGCGVARALVPRGRCERSTIACACSSSARRMTRSSRWGSSPPSGATNADHRAEVQRVGVRARDARPRHRTSASMAALEAAAHRESASPLLWLTTHDGTDACAFYEAIGYTKMGAMPELLATS